MYIHIPVRTNWMHNKHTGRRLLNRDIIRVRKEETDMHVMRICRINNG